MKLSKKANSPLEGKYCPEIDITTELNGKSAAYYQSLIWVLCWIVELGRADITVEVSIMASFMAPPRQGHLDQVLHIFAYFKNKHNCEIILTLLNQASVKVISLEKIGVVLFIVVSRKFCHPMEHCSIIAMCSSMG